MPQRAISLNCKLRFWVMGVINKLIFDGFDTGPIGDAWVGIVAEGSVGGGKVGLGVAVLTVAAGNAARNVGCGVFDPEK